MTKTIHSKRHRYLVKAVIEARERAGISQTELARRFKQYQSWAARLESGERRIDVCEFLLLAEAIGFNPVKLLEELIQVEARGDHGTGAVPAAPARSRRRRLHRL